MSALGLQTVLRTLAMACVAAWLGIMAFFSFVAAPGVFRVLDRRLAAETVAALLPTYYRWGLALSAVAVVAFLILAAWGPAGRRRHLISAVLATAMVVTVAWALAVTLPTADTARRSRDDAQFAAAHRAAVRLNVTVMVCALGVLALQSVTPKTRRGG